MTSFWAGKNNEPSSAFPHEGDAWKLYEEASTKGPPWTIYIAGHNKNAWGIPESTLAVAEYITRNLPPRKAMAFNKSWVLTIQPGMDLRPVWRECVYWSLTNKKAQPHCPENLQDDLRKLKLYLSREKKTNWRALSAKFDKAFFNACKQRRHKEASFCSTVIFASSLEHVMGKSRDKDNTESFEAFCFAERLYGPGYVQALRKVFMSAIQKSEKANDG